MNTVGEAGMLTFTAAFSCTLSTTIRHHRPGSARIRSSSTVSTVSPMESLPASSEAKDISDKKKPNYVFIVNPNGSNGKTAANWKKLFPKLSLRLGDYTVSEKLTTGPYHATQLTREAIHGGAAAIIAVGGDGTLHEVVNGFFEDGKRVVQPEESGDSSSSSRTALGLIPLGTGSDFARFYGWNSDPMKALDRIEKGEKTKIDVGRVTYGKEQVERFFVNVADLHLSAKSGFYAGKHKALGNFCYVVGCLRAFWGHRNRDFKIRFDNGDWQTVSSVSAICVGNSSYFGGGMKIAPAANPSSGDLEVVTLNDFKWYDFLMQLPNLYAGTHIEKNKNVTSVRIRTLDVEEVAIEENYPGTYVQADGEPLGFLNASFSVLPGAIDLIL